MKTPHMQIASGRIDSYRLTLRHPVGQIRERSGWLITLIDACGFRGIGDVAPLAGFSEETAAETSCALEQALQGKTVLGRRVTQFGEINALLRELNLPPAAQHGVDQALLALWAQHTQQTIAQLIAEEPSNVRWRVPVHRLVMNADEARVAVAAGNTTLKTKVGRESLEADTARLAAIRSAVGADIALRIDANGAWAEVDEALCALRAMNAYVIDSVEQPLRSLAAMAQLRSFSPIPIAADESVRSLADMRACIAQNAADAVVIKPMLCGGLQAAIQIAVLAAHAGLSISVTTTLESGFGRAGALQVAAAAPGDLWSCGLLTSDLFVADLTSKVSPEEGCLAVPAQMQPEQRED